MVRHMVAFIKEKLQTGSVKNYLLSVVFLMFFYEDFIVTGHNIHIIFARRFLIDSSGLYMESTK